MIKLFDGFKTYVIQSIPDIRLTDILEMIIIAFILYNLMVWIKNTRAWALLKGIIVVLVFILFAYILRMDTILFLAGKLVNVAVVAVVIIFQPEFRRALEQIGQNKVLGFLMSDSGNREEEGFRSKTINEIVKASFEMGKARTGALIVIEQQTPLAEYERTGISVDGIVTSQLLLNIFEHNTPLHDGAVIICGNRISAATCYLPLSENMQISKALGTRHRAAVGVSEVSDSITIIVSEETGQVSVAYDGKLEKQADADALKNKLKEMIEDGEEHKTRLKILKGRQKNERKADK